MGQDRDIVINLRHLMDFGKGDFEIEILNNDQTVRNMKEYVDAASELV
jgi:hypothetical protein